MRFLYSLNVPESVPYLYPRMFQLHNLSDPVGELDELNQVIMPPRIRLSGERMEAEGAYLLENGQQIILWIGRGVSPTFLEQLLGVTDLNSVDINMVRIYISEFVFN